MYFKKENHNNIAYKLTAALSLIVVNVLLKRQTTEKNNTQ